MNTHDTGQPNSASAPTIGRDEHNPLANILFNIVIPVFILNQVSKRIPENGPQIALALALLFPLGFGLIDWRKRRKVNVFSGIGIANVLITGSLAVLALHGKWFVLKEVALPIILGAAILASAFSRRPFVQTLFLNPKILRMDRLTEKLRENHKEDEFHSYLRRATFILALSFACSAVVNFILASRIFTEIDSTLTPAAQSLILNQQIAQMTWKAALIIIVPSTIFTAFILYYLLGGIRKLTGLSSEDVLQS